MKLAAASLTFILLASGVASAGYLTSEDLRRRCSGLEGQTGRSFCDGYLQGQIEAFAQREALGNSRRCVSGFSEAQLRALRSHLLEWLSPPGTSQMGFPASASTEIERALSNANLCP